MGGDQGCGQDLEVEVCWALDSRAKGEALLHRKEELEIANGNPHRPQGSSSQQKPKPLNP